MPNLTISILALEETMIYTLAGPYDIFSAAAACSLQAAPTAPPLKTDTRIVGVKKGPMRCYNGFSIATQQSLEEVTKTDLIIIPSLDFADEPYLKKYPNVKDWLVGHHQKGAVIASICAGSFLLAETGLLTGKIATTHWAFADAMQEQFPLIDVHSDMIITEQDNIICAGGATSWQDLVVYLLEKYTTDETARHIEKFFLLNSHQEGQLPYKQLKSSNAHADFSIRESQDCIEKNLKHVNLLMLATQQSKLSERTFKRRFKQVTKQTPNEYIQNARIDQAKYLLLTCSLSVQGIAEQVGLADGSYFRRLFKRKTKMTAQEFKRQFSSRNNVKKVLRLE